MYHVTVGGGSPCIFTMNLAVSPSVTVTGFRGRSTVGLSGRATMSDDLSTPSNHCKSTLLSQNRRMSYKSVRKIVPECFLQLLLTSISFHLVLFYLFAQPVTFSLWNNKERQQSLQSKKTNQSLLLR